VGFELLFYGGYFTSFLVTLWRSCAVFISSTCMKAISPEELLGPALNCFAERGLQGTSIDYLTNTLGVSHRVFYDVLGNKAAAIEAVYAHATALLFGDKSLAPHPRERLQSYLGRWWQQTAAAAQIHPQAFTFWQYYRTSPHVAAVPVLGPFSSVSDLIADALARPGSYSAAALPLPVLGRSLAAQWTAAVEVVLAESACQTSSVLRERVLTHAYTSWWQGSGLAQHLLADGAKKAPGASPFWQMVAAAAVQHFGNGAAGSSPEPGK
jgi:AcrR family transcriptional regulator